jgi:Flp pilus assembly protein TadB
MLILFSNLTILLSACELAKVVVATATTTLFIWPATTVQHIGLCCKIVNLYARKRCHTQKWGRILPQVLDVLTLEHEELQYKAHVQLHWAMGGKCWGENIQ